ncbi:enoyl-[acyl-carrier-protein] reductase FabK [Bacillota bacterium LX-D]|nr:enoyl-[acyl-carrier-protein] reductase FabK [Bacillota bacterium LX-D]
MLKTDLCNLLNIKYPIIQGGMAWVATGELAAAVSAAGGLGIIGAGSAPPDIVRQEISKVQAATDKPFGVNVYYLSPYVDELVNLVTEMKVPVVTTGAGNPGKHIAQFKEAGTIVLPVVSSVALAKRLARLGVDGFIAEGMECGGHVGELTTMALVPQIVDAVELPVVAAGGIADGRGLVAALALGACGVQIGTRFICATECTVHPNYKRAVLEAKDRDTVLTGLPGHEVRVLKNKLTRKFDELIANHGDISSINELGIGKLRLAAIEGDVDEGSVMAGQVAAMVKGLKPAAEIITEVVSEAQLLLQKLSDYLGGTNA